MADHELTTTQREPAVIVGTITAGAAAEGGQPAPGAVQLAHLTLIAGEMVDCDLRAELDLLRSELDLVKRELRRLGRD